MSTNPILDQHALELAEIVGSVVDVIQEGNRLFVVLRGHRLPEGASKAASTEILVIADTQYPFSAMDMFWTDLDVVMPNGSAFEGSDSIEEYLGKRWRRFSYHRNGVWNPSGNPLLDHFAFTETRWTEKAKQ